MSAEFWAIIGGSAFVGLAVLSVGGKLRRVIAILDGLDGRLHEIDQLIVRIPGVENYEPPDGLEWHEQHKKNPAANSSDRRNWVR